MRLVYVGVLAALILAMAASCLAQSPTGETPRAAQIKSQVHAILSSGDYHFEPPGESWPEKTGKWLREQWDRLMKWLERIFRFGGSRAGGAAGGGAAILPYVLVGALIIGIAYLIAYAVRRVSVRGLARKRGKAKTGLTLEPEESAAAEPDSWLAAARRHAEAGDFRRAYRAIFIGILIRFDRAGALRYERFRTNGEYLRALRSRPKLFQYLRPLANGFDACWYGRAPVTQAEYRQALAAYEQFPDTSISA